MKMRRTGVVLWTVFAAASTSLLFAQEVAVSGRIEPAPNNPARSAKNTARVVVWLTPLDAEGAASPPAQEAQLVQRGKTFEPHLLVIPAGTTVAFPNRDPFFHNVFSLFEGRRFDLGLYEAGSTRSVQFNRPGVSYIFCNIHPEMSAVVIALKTPYYAVGKVGATYNIAGVPAGRYRMEVWREGTSVTLLRSLARTVTISADSNTLPSLQVPQDSPVQAHKNMYGHEYDPASDSPYQTGPHNH